MSRFTLQERWQRTVKGRHLGFYLSRGTEDRIRAYMDRVNHEAGGDTGQPYRFDADVYDEELEIAIESLVRRALEDHEKEHGLRGTDWGEIFSEEVGAEMVRRQRG